MPEVRACRGGLQNGVRALELLLLSAFLNGFAQVFSGMESRHVASGDHELLPRLRIASFPGFALADFKAAERDQLHLLAFCERTLHALEEIVDDVCHVAAR